MGCVASSQKKAVPPRSRAQSVLSQNRRNSLDKYKQDKQKNEAQKNEMNKQATKQTTKASNQVEGVQNNNKDDDNYDVLYPERESSILAYEEPYEGSKAGKLDLHNIADLVDRDNQSHYNNGMNSNFSFFPNGNHTSSKPVGSSDVELKSTVTAHFIRGLDTLNDLGSRQQIKLGGLDLNKNFLQSEAQQQSRGSLNSSNRKQSYFGSESSKQHNSSNFQRDSINQGSDIKEKEKDNHNNNNNNVNLVHMFRDDKEFCSPTSPVANERGERSVVHQGFVNKSFRYLEAMQ